LFESITEESAWFKLAYLKKRALDSWLMYLMALLDGLSIRDIETVCREFAFRKGERMRLISYKRMAPAISKFLNRPRRLPPSEIYRTLEPLSYETMLAIMARSQSRLVKKRISDFLTRYNGVRLSMKGRDLEEMGLKAGPFFKKVLDAVLYAKLDKGLNSKSRELEFAKRIIKR
jgi:tRNA nucleotidyltransferase (CCA-adding enzyme)